MSTIFFRPQCVCLINGQVQWDINDFAFLVALGMWVVHETLAGIILLWLVCLNILELPELRWVLGLRDRCKFPPFFSRLKLWWSFGCRQGCVRWLWKILHETGMMSYAPLFIRYSLNSCCHGNTLLPWNLFYKWVHDTNLENLRVGFTRKVILTWTCHNFAGQ